MATTVEKCHAANAVAAGEKHKVKPSDILAILDQEGGTDSNCRPVAPADGMGPPSFGQFITSTGASLGVEYGNSASECDAVARYLNQMGYGSGARMEAFAKYNGGPGNPQWGYAASVSAKSIQYRKYDTKNKSLIKSILEALPKALIGPDDPALPDSLGGDQSGSPLEDAIGEVGIDDPLQAVKSALDTLTSGSTWKNVAFVVGGGVALSIGVLILAAEFMQKVPTPVSAVAKGALKSGK